MKTFTEKMTELQALSDAEAANRARVAAEVDSLIATIRPKLTERPTFGPLKLTADDCRGEAQQFAAQAKDSEGEAKTNALEWSKRWHEYADALRRREEILKRNGYTW